MDRLISGDLDRSEALERRRDLGCGADHDDRHPFRWGNGPLNEGRDVVDSHLSDPRPKGRKLVEWQTIPLDLGETTREGIGALQTYRELTTQIAPSLVELRRRWRLVPEPL